MNKKIFTLLLLSMVCLGAFAGKEDLYLLHEGFESGIPASWSQISEAGQQSWITESADVSEYPAGVVTGNSRAVLRNTTGQTQHFVTKLVLPVLDLTETADPVVIFSHAQAQRAGIADELRVYYRTSAAAPWTLIREFTSKITHWQSDTIALPEPSATYQIAFEGTDNYGRGIVIDDVIVRPAPSCDIPGNIAVESLSNTGAVIRWNGSLTTEAFHVLICTKEITNPEQPQGVVFDQVISDESVAISDLSRNTKYYVSIQARCEEGISEWVSYSFTTKNLAAIPLIESFDKDYASGTISHPNYWTCGTSIKKDDGSMEFMPFINQNTAESGWKNYSFSGTTCFVFSGARNISTDVPAGEYVYAATPELNVESVKNLQVSFWGTCYTYYSANNANGLIVGVMTDPADWSTFVPVDTVYIKEAQSFDKFTVYFSNYAGEGKYIAFASNFVDKPNMFFMDELEIKGNSGVKAPTNVSLFNATSKSISINADMNGEPASKVYITKHVIDAETGQAQLNPLAKKFGAENILATYDVTSFPYTAVLPENVNGMFVQVYVQNINGNDSSDFALPQKQLVPKHWDGVSEMLINFDNTAVSNNWVVNEVKNFWNNSSPYEYPYEMITDFFTEPGLASYSNVYTVRYPLLGGTSAASKYHSAKGAVYLKRDRRVFGDGTEWVMPHGQYAAFPEVDDLSTFYLQFYLAAYSDSHPEAAGVYVGVMTDPFDAATFDTIALVTCGIDWTMALVSFTDYKGQGHFPAIMAATMLTDESWPGAPGSGSGKIYQDYNMSATWIDDVKYLKSGGCMSATGLTAAAGYDTVALSWNANEMEKWVVTVCKDAAMKDTVASDTVTTPSYIIKDLMPHTTYYYNVVAICNGQPYVSDNASFKTECGPSELIPYVEDFESYTGGSSTQDLPACWNITLQKYTSSSSSETSTSWYPYIYTVESTAHAGKKCLYFYYSNSTSGVTPSLVNKPTYVTLPLMSEDLNKLQFSFWMKAGGTNHVNDSVYVGVMSDPNDLATFDTLQLIKTTAAYTEYIIRLDKYQGQGKYIALMKTAREVGRSVYIDDIKVDYLANCEKVQGVTANNFNEVGAVVSWTKGDATQWELKLTSKEMNLDTTNVDTIAKYTVKDTLVVAQPFTIDFCPATNTQYYVYVRAICGESNKGDWSNAISFKTTCVAKTTEGYGFIDFAADNFNANEFPCWTVGKREGTTANPSVTAGSHLYMFNTTASEGAYAIMPPIDVDSINRLQVTFTASGGTGAAYLKQLTVGVISNPSDLSTFEPIETVSLPQAVTTISKANHAKNLDEAQTYIVRFDKYAGDYEGNFGKQIMFLSENGGVANYVYIFSMQVDTIPSCQEPTKMEDVEINTYDATVAWETTGNNYEVQLLADDKTTVLLDSVTDKLQMKFEGLEMLTQYYMQVRTICAVEDTSAWSPIHGFKTQCPTFYTLPYEQNFDDYASGAANYPDCWERFSNSSTTYPYIYSSAKKEGKNGLYMYRTTSYYSYAVLPAFEGKPGSLMLEFDYRNSSTSYPMELYVGIATDITSAEGIDSTVVMLDTVTAVKYSSPNNIWYHYALSLDAYTGDNGRIVLISPIAATSSTNGYAYIDNLYVSRTPSCFRPIDPTFASATASSLTLTWTPQGKETAWDIACVAAGGDIKDATIVTVSGDGPKGTVTGLTDATDYDLYVRANCGEGDFSEWSSVITATTLCKFDVADAQWNFDDQATQIQSPYTTTSTYKEERCWLVGNKNSTSYSYIPYLNKNAYNATYGTVSSKYAYSDSCALRLYSITSYNGAYAVMPEIVGDLGEMQVSFVGRSVYESYSTSAATAGQFSKYYNTYATGSYARGIKVGTVTDPYDMSTFEEIADYQFAEVTAAVCSTKVEGDYWEPVTVSLYGAAGKYVAFLSEYDATNYVWIDNVKVEPETGLNMPTLVTLDEETLTGDHADLTWKSRATKFEVEVTNTDKRKVIFKDTLETVALSLDGLTMITNYSVSIKAMNETMTETSAPAVFKFKTPCMPYDETNAKWDFSAASAIYAYTGSTTYNIPECWEAGQLTKGGTSNSYMPQVKVSTSNTYVYGREDDTSDGALQFYNYSNTYGNSYAVLPELNVDYESTALHFWIRAAQFWPEGAALAANKSKIREANTNYPKDLLIGTVSDVSDMTTFVQQDKVTYPYDLASTVYNYNDETGNNYWIEVLLPLRKYKDKGHIVLYYPLGQKTGYMYIDDLEIIHADFCSPVTNVSAQNLTATSADITWSITGKDSVCLQIASAENFNEEAILVNDTLSDAEGLDHVSNLEPGTDYYVRLMHFCSEEESSDWTIAYNFTTPYKVRFNEQFSTVRTYPKNWSRAKSVVGDVLDNGEMPNPVSDNITANWVRSATTSDMTVTTGNASGSSDTENYYNYWLMTPTISLKDVDEAQKLMLSFDLYLTDNSHAQPFNNPSEFDRFIVVVSTDGGKTFPRANAVIWDAAGTDRKYSDFSGVATVQMVDLTRYIGQDIVIAFVHDAHSELDKACSRNYVHLDNVQVNTYTEKKYEASICQYNDYEDEDFFVDADDLIVGETTKYTKLELATTDGEDDFYSELSLTVNSAVESSKSVTLDKGEDYLEDNFTIYNIQESGTYRLILESAAGCDSLSIVEISVLKSATETYTREGLTAGQIGTLCLGYASESFSGASFYELDYYDGANSLYVNAADTLIEGVPYIFEAEGESFSIEYIPTDQPAEAQSVNGLHGFIGEDENDVYILTEPAWAIVSNEVVKAAIGSSIPAHRAYIVLDEVATSPKPGVVARKLNVVHGQGTGLETLHGAQCTMHDGKYIINDRFVIIHNGKKYNAQGCKY